MKIQVYPFLVSRNRTLDYRTVVAPRFLCDNGAAHELARAAGGRLTPPGHAVYRKIQIIPPENLILVFRVIESNQQEIYSNASDETLTDPFGREILWIEGFIVKNKINLLNLTVEAFEIVHKQLLSSYRLFWESTDLFEVAVIPSEVIDLDITANNLKKIICKEISPFPDWSDIGIC
ncbi:hypothetical protein [Leptolyngbya sp. ST-U4]|uniref:hypothetical protein n=1 Tax=Leptolyngbya sp. ST-U4 TaxID=2933912 RepID=UPI003299574B